MNVQAVSVARPRTRAECPANSEPCPFVTCRFHLWLDRELDRHGAVIDFHETAAWGDKCHTCVLRQADHGGRTLDEIAKMYGLTRERIRQVEADAIVRCRRQATPALRELADAPAAEDDHDDDSTDDTGWPEQGESDESGAPEPGDSDSTTQRHASKAASELRRRRAMAAAAEASPLVPCPRCGAPMHALTRTGKPREVCSTSCSHRTGRSPRTSVRTPVEVPCGTTATCLACGRPIPTHAVKGYLRRFCGGGCARWRGGSCHA